MSADVYDLSDFRDFDIGTPRRCYRCGASENVVQSCGEGGWVWACPACPHPAD